MKKLTAILLFATGTLLFVSSYAQQAEIDSLENLLKTAKEDNVKLNTLNMLSKVFWLKSPQKAIEYANQALLIAEKLDDKVKISVTLNVKGMAEYYLGNY